MARKNEVNIEIDSLTNSIVNVISGEVFETEFSRLTKKEISKKDWVFDWHEELKDRNSMVYKMTIVESEEEIQGLISCSVRENFIFVSLAESAKFNRGIQKKYEGVGGNLFAYACKVSMDMGFGGFVSFISKTQLIEYYSKALGAQRGLDQRMFIDDVSAEKLINHYFKNK